MIKPEELTPGVHEGRIVWYEDYVGHDRGRIKGWGTNLIFVVFPKTEEQFDNYRDYTSQGCRPEKLFWDAPSPVFEKRAKTMYIVSKILPKPPEIVHVNCRSTAEVFM